MSAALAVAPITSAALPASSACLILNIRMSCLLLNSLEGDLRPDADFLVLAFDQAADRAVAGADRAAAVDLLVLVDEREIDVLARMRCDADVEVLVLEIGAEVFAGLRGIAAREDA